MLGLPSMPAPCCDNCVPGHRGDWEVRPNPHLLHDVGRTGVRVLRLPPPFLDTDDRLPPPSPRPLELAALPCGPTPLARGSGRGGGAR